MKHQLPFIPNKMASNPIYSVSQSITDQGIFGLNFSQIINNEAIQIGTTSLPGFAFSNQFIQFMFGFMNGYNTSFGWGELI